jgi:tetratricopeptide (TPR) repeat protein
LEPRRNINYFILSLILISLYSCDRYPQVDLNKRIFPKTAEQNENKIKKNQFDEILKRYKVPAADDKSYYVMSSKINRISYKRYFSDVFSFSPLGEIINRGVEYALRGMYAEAEILFNEVLKEDEKCSSAYNNLGVIYEMNNKDKAFTMYSKACILEPDNEYYRWNFLYFCDNKSDSVLY